MKVPENITKRLEELRAEKQKRLDEEIALIERRGRELRELDALRIARLADSVGYAGGICGWIKEFIETPEAREILSARKRIRIFSARFWQDRPAPDSVATWATIELRVHGVEFMPTVHYAEYHKGMRAKDDLLCLAKNILTDDLICALHPDFLKQWDEEIKSGKIWQYIENSLR